MKKLLLFSTLFLMGLLLASCAGESGGEGDTDSTATDSTEALTEIDDTETMEPEGKTIVALAQETADLSTLVTALQAAGLVDALNGEGPFTVFAPTNEAFKALGTTLDDLLKPENKEKLAAILKYHVVSGKVMAADITDGQKAATLNGAEITITTTGGVKLNGKATVTTADVAASNGVVHIIDAVILPPDAK
jgi:uncharacterized surface protein with fasciclin (FAS1) repeats